MSFVILWEFKVKDGRLKEFEAAYGSDGIWAVFFRQGKGYLGTELLADSAVPGRYVTVDKWTSREAYESFRGSHRAEYADIDKQCEALTVEETLMGSFVPEGGDG